MRSDDAARGIITNIITAIITEKRIWIRYWRKGGEISDLHAAVVDEVTAKTR